MTPEEYNAQLQSLQQRRAIANAMLTQSMTAGKDWGNDHYRHSPWEAVANLGSTYLNKQNLDTADAKVQAATKARQDEIAQAMGQYNNSTPDSEVGARALDNLRAAPEGELPATVNATPRSAAVRNLGRVALGPDKQAEMIVAQAAKPDELGEVSQGGTVFNKRTGQAVFTAPAKPDTKEQQPLDELAKLNADFTAKRISKSDYDARRALMTTRAGGGPGETFSNAGADVLGALAAKGVSLPTGMRSKAQQVATVNALIRKYPGDTPDQIATRIAKGQVDFGAIKKETQTAAAQAGRVAIAANELKTFAPIVLKASAAMPRGSFVPINKLLQMGDQAISDPALKRLKIGVTSMLNAYDQLAARGGTDAAKREEAHSLLTTAESPEALAAGIEMFQVEAEAAGKAADMAEQYRDADASAAPPAGKPAAVPDDIAALLKKHGGK